MKHTKRKNFLKKSMRLVEKTARRNIKKFLGAKKKIDALIQHISFSRRRYFSRLYDRV